MDRKLEAKSGLCHRKFAGPAAGKRIAAAGRPPHARRMPRGKAVLFVLLVLALGGCGRKGGWLEGTWVLDKEMTRRKIEEQAAQTAEKNAGLGGIMKNLAGSMAAPMVLGMLGNVEITFTGDEILTTVNGSGQATAYEVLETPDRDTVVIKKADGEVQTFRRVGDRVTTAASGPMALPIYLQRAQK